MNEPEKRRIDRIEELGIDRSEMDYDYEGESEYE